MPFARCVIRLLLVCLPPVLLAACNPTFNWRETRLPDAELVALLPCKPDRAERDLPLGAARVPVRMVGCEAGGATFAVAQARADDAAQASQWLAAWQTQARGQWAGARIEEGVATVAHAAAQPAPWRLDARREGGAPAAAARVQQLWFAHAQAGGVALYQATVLGTPSQAGAAATFFEGLRLP